MSFRAPVSKTFCRSQDCHFSDTRLRNTETMAWTTARSAVGHSWMSTVRISMASRWKRAMAPRALSHSSCRVPSGSKGATAAYMGPRIFSW